MLVKEVMKTNVRTARIDSNVSDVATIMCLNKISGMPVVDGNRRILGIISEKDIFNHMYPNIHEVMGAEGQIPANMEVELNDLETLRVEDLMTRDVLTVTSVDPLLHAISIMVQNNIRRIPVSRDGILEGIISMGDVHKAIFQRQFSKNFEAGLLAKDMHLRPAVLRQ